MSEKSTGKFLQQLEESIAGKNPVIMETANAYHELDQINYDLGLIEMDESVASKISWWPVISYIGSSSSGKPEFINKIINQDIIQSGIHANSNKISVLFQSSGDQAVTLPGTAVDGDPRFPFFHFSEQLDMLEEGEGRQINSYLELKTIQSTALKGKIMISAPGFSQDPYDLVLPYFIDHIAKISDLVLIFFDAEETDLESIDRSLQKFIDTANSIQNPEKFIFIIHQPETSNVPVNIEEWKNRLTEKGLYSGRFYALNKSDEAKKPVQENRLFMQVTDKGHHSQPNNADIKAIEKLLDNVEIDSAYRIVGSLGVSIHELDEVVMQEVRDGLKLWKDRSHFTISLLLSLLAVAVVMAELQIGFLAFFIDPIIGPIALVLLVALTIPIHLFSSKQHAKWVIKHLNRRQKELGLIENLAGVFEQNLTFWRILLPVTEPVAWNKEIKFRLHRMLEKSKDLVQHLNDSFSATGNKPF